MPRLRGSSLAGEALTFPDDLVADITVLIVAFRQAQQADVDTWLPVCAALARARPGFAYFEVPLLKARWRVARAMIDGGMRAGISDPDVRATTVTVYGGRGAFLRALGVRRGDEIIVVAVDPSGVVAWNTRGPFRAAAGTALERLLAGP